MRKQRRTECARWITFAIIIASRNGNNQRINNPGVDFAIDAGDNKNVRVAGGLIEFDELCFINFCIIIFKHCEIGSIRQKR